MFRTIVIIGLVTGWGLLASVSCAWAQLEAGEPTASERSDMPEVEHLGGPADAPQQPLGAKADSKEASTSSAPSQSQCLAAHEKAQLQRIEGRLIESEEQLKICSHVDCPQVIVDDCVTWSGEMGGLIPTVVVLAKKGELDIVSARVLLDGEPWAQSLDGRPLRVNPGPHRISVTLEDGQTKELEIVLSQGASQRILEFRFPGPEPEQVTRAPGAGGTAAAKPLSQEDFHRPVPVATYVLGAAAVVSTGIFVGFGVQALSLEQAAKDECEPLCSESVSTDVRQSAAIADVALGVALLAGAGATLTYAFRPRVGVSGAVGKSTQRKLGRLAVSSLPGGARLNLSWRIR